MSEPGTSPWKKILLAVLLVVLAGHLGYRWWFAEGEEVGSARPVSAFLVNWQCLSCSHRVEQNAGMGPQQCPKCGKKELYVTINWACPTHGARNVAFQYTPEGRPAQVRTGEGKWGPALDADGGWNIRCPSCGQVMMPAEKPKAAE